MEGEAILVHICLMWRLFRGSRPLVRWARAALLLLATSAAATAGKPEGGNVWFAGAYSFSDELGGFQILGVSGTGLRDDPFVITEELNSASPVTMVIRATAPIRTFDQSGKFASGFMHFRIVAENNSGHPWLEFEFELQEILGQPSVFGDGLSFDQSHTPSDFISSDSFVRYDRQLEPFDRLRFLDGHVDTRHQATFDFLVTDFNPNSVFYLLQDPGIPAS